MENKLVNAVVGQSGGPTQAINATLYGVIKGALKSGKIATLYGMQNGVDGLLKDKLVSLNFLMEDKNASRLMYTPASFLGSCRTRLPVDFDRDEYEKIFSVLKENNIGYCFYIGGNDSMDTVDKLNRYSKEKCICISFIGVPKTIDNDLIITDHTPGFGSASKYVATIIKEIAYDVSVYDIPSVTIVEVMGRESGWLACASAIPTYFYGMGADLVYLPEGDFSKEKLVSQIKELQKKKKSLLVCVSEGIPIAHENNGNVDSFGHYRLSGVGKILEEYIGKTLRCKARSIELNLPQRCAGHILSRTDVEESYMLGEKAVYYALNGETGKMLCLKRMAKKDYEVEVFLADASQVANKTKRVPLDFISSDGCFVTEKCISYMAPLIEGEVNIEYERGMPLYYACGREKFNADK